MNHRDRAVAAMWGKPVDRIPFIARMDLWYSYHHNRGTLPHPYEKATLWEIQRDMGIGIFGFGAWDISFFRTEYPDGLIHKTVESGVNVTQFDTPYGTLTARDIMSEELKEAAGTAARVEFPFKTAADYDALEYVLDSARVLENYERYAAFVGSIGTDGLALPFCGHLPAHQLMLNYLGYDRFYYELVDNEDRLLKLVDSINNQYEAVLKLALKAPGQAVEVGANYDEMMTPPPVFERFFGPLYRKARPMLERAGKAMVVHGDGEMKKLLSSLADCDIQVVEALTPKPMTTIDLKTTRELWGDRVAMWGGLPTVILTSAFTEGQFEAHLEQLFEDVAPGDRFILGYGDNVPTDAIFTRIQQVANFWHERSSYPLR